MMIGPLQIWTMRTTGLTEADTAGWLHLLDENERSRAARFVFERHRTTFIAAHVLARCVLSRIDGAQRPEAWRFVAGEHGKPAAWAPVGRACAGQEPVGRAPPDPLSGGGPLSSAPLSSGSTTRAGATLRDGPPSIANPPSRPPAGYAPAHLTFNLSHTEGLVGLATLPVPGRRLGFDVESAGRPVNLDVADRFFRPEETTWLHALPEAGRAEGFLRLWTLKEAFIKATGEGLAHDLASFWFRVPEATINFAPPDRDASPDSWTVQDDPSEWQFEQLVVSGGYLAAVGLQRPAGSHVRAIWVDVVPGMLRNDGSGLPNS